MITTFETARILFVPPITNPVFTESFSDAIPVGILGLASSVREAGFSAEVYFPSGFLYSDEDYNPVARQIVDTGCPIIGFSCWCHSFPSSLLLANKIKELNPNAVILFGGPHATVLDVATMKAHRQVDFVLRGEADFTIIEFLDRLFNGGRQERFASISGLTWRNGSGTHASIERNSMTDYPKDLDALPIPSYELLPKDYATTYSLDIGRGCPYQCTFCSTNQFFSRTFRAKSPDRVTEELNLLIGQTGTHTFSFTHDSLTARRTYVEELCSSIKEYQKRAGTLVRWTCSSRIDCVDENLLEMMADAGCRGIFFGVETGSERIQKLIKKNLKLHKVPHVISKCVSLSIEPTVAFMAGFPQETRQDVESTLQTVLDVAALKARPQISLLSLQPGTELHEQYNSELKYDGYYTDFSGVICGPEERKMIEADPVLFSSFFYLPVTSTTRNTLILINKVVNDVPRFLYSLRLLWPKIKSHFYDLQLLQLLEKIDGVGNASKEDVGDYHCQILQALNDFLDEQVKQNNSLIPPFFWDVYTIESASAIMCWQFVQRQVEGRGSQKSEHKKKVILNDRVAFVLDNWTIVQARQDLNTVLKWIDKPEEFLQAPASDAENICDYLIIAHEERNGEPFRVRGWKSEVLKQLRKDEYENVDEFLYSLPTSIAINEYEEFLAKLEHIGVIQFENKK